MTTPVSFVRRLRESERAWFLLKFAAAICSLYVVMALGVVDEHFVTPFSRGVTAVSAATLNGFGQEVTRVGTIITNGRFAVNVKNGCNGLEAVLLIVAGVISFPALWRDRLTGLLILIGAVQLFNIVRVVSLYIIGRDYPQYFDAAHVTLWQSVMFLFSIAVFTLWSSRVSKQRESRS